MIRELRVIVYEIYFLASAFSAFLQAKKSFRAYAWIILRTSPYGHTHEKIRSCLLIKHCFKQKQAENSSQ